MTKEIKLKAGEVQMTTQEIVTLYNLINPAKLTKMTDSKAKFAIIKNNKALKTVAENFEAFQKDALEKLKDEKFDEMQQRAQKWQNGKQAETPEERTDITEINTYFSNYQNEVNKCLIEESEKKNAVKLEKITEDQFELFLDGNDWSVEQTSILYDALV